MTRRGWLAIVVLLMACSESGPTCGAGTVAKDGKCVATASALQCGAGTVAEKGVCVLVDGGTAFDANGGLDGTGPTDAAAGDSVGVGCGAGCPKGQKCSPEGACVPAGAPAGWVCAPSAFGDGELCDCACGILDPDCANAALPVAHCGSGKCGADGTCAECVPACSGKTCGPDGCGSACGQCLSPGAPFCQDGQCVATCTPKCTGKGCGPDGCGGSCGACNEGETCTFGQCAEIAEVSSCLGHCGGKAPSGCGCSNTCTAAGTCCADFVNNCGCVPSCDGKLCGEDGCGGQCGTCAAGETCVSGGCEKDPCDPDPCAGNGTCNATTGACTCKVGYTGAGCNQCDVGFAGYPNCQPDLCAGKANACSGKGICQTATGGCDCDAGFAGANCSACAPGQGTWPNCTDPCASKPNCDDGNACTADSCGKNAGCVHAPTVIGCDDGNACTVGDLCVDGTCKAGGKVCDFAVTAPDDSDDGTCDAKHCSLREAIGAALAKGGGGIGLDVEGTITLASALPTITAPVAIVAPGSAVTIDGGGKSRIFHAQANLSLTNVIVQAGSGGAQGGGVWQESGTLTMQGVQVRNCQATVGAGVYAAAGAKLSDCAFADNAGGAVFADASLEVTRSLFANNATAGSGAGIVCSVSCVATVARSAFVGNAAATGGGMYVQGKAAITSTAFTSNSASANGGGLAAPGKVTIVHSTFYGNISPNVSGILATGSLDLRNSVVGGSASGGGDCAASALLGTVSNLVEDGSCNATLKGPLGAGDLAWCNGLFAFVPASGSPLLDGADTGVCAAAGAVDLCGKARPVGSGCEIGAVEFAP